MMKDLSPKKAVVQKSGMSLYEKFKVTSVTLSVLVLCWTLSHPFRDSSLQTRSEIQSGSKSIDPVSQMSHRSDDSQEYRDEAIAMDMEFMDEIRAKRETDARRYRPGDQEVKQTWAKRAEDIETEMELLKDAQEGSIQYERRESLGGILADGPV